MEIVKVLEEDNFIKNILCAEKFNQLIEFISKLNQSEINFLYNGIEKNPSKNLLLSNLKYNDFGLYISRCIYAENYINSKFEKYRKENEYFNKYLEDGYLVIENFLPENDFSLIETDFNNIVKNTNLYSDGGFGLKKIFYNNLSQNIINFYHNEKLIELLKLCSFDLEGKDIKNNQRNYIEILSHIKTSDDPQKVWHVDTFHPTCKWWFYTKDILDKDLGPLEYVKGSHKNTFEKLKYEHETINHVLNNRLECFGTKAGSIRFFNSNLVKQLGFKDEDFKKLFYKKNTLIITNNRGIHRRGHGKIAATRYSLSSSLRFNIYN